MLIYQGRRAWTWCSSENSPGENLKIILQFYFEIKFPLIRATTSRRPVHLRRRKQSENYLLFKKKELAGGDKISWTRIKITMQMMKMVIIRIATMMMFMMGIRNMNRM